MTLDEISKSIDEAAAGFKQMQTVLLVFCGLATVAILLITVKLINEEKS